MEKFFYQILITYTDGSQSVIPFNTSTTEVSDKYVSVKAGWSDMQGLQGHTLNITLQPIQRKQLRFFDVKVKLPEDIYNSDPLVFFSGYSTNDVADCVPLKARAYSATRDDILYKGNGRLVGAGFSTADRFFTYILLEDRWFLMRHSMENKCLKDEEYHLEEMFFCYPESTEVFFDTYTDLLALHYDIPELTVPTGWCSWSCYYKDVDQEKIERAHSELNRFYSQKRVNTLQIDDGWQSNGSFSGFWELDRVKFPDGLDGIANSLKKDGITFGLWLAPLLASRDSGFFTAHPEMKQTACQEVGEPDNSYMCGEDPVWTLDIGEQKTVEYICDVFRRCNKEYGAEYFKLDFMIFALIKLYNMMGSFVVYEEDYATAIYRRVIRAIRETVGDAFMLACGSPISESVGVFNGIRVTPDIIWGKIKMAPTAWELIKMCTCSIACRYFYNGKLFVNDPDGLVVRDFDQDDGFDVTYQEARTWATSVAMSGGSSLINEQMERIGGMRREFFSHILPPLGVAARPVDFFEQPQPSRLYIKNPDGSVIVALYNFSDKMADLELDLAEVGITGEAVCMRTWTKNVVGTVKGKLVCPDVIGHSAEVFTIMPIGKTPCFAFACCNIYGGAGIYSWEYKKNKLHVLANDRLSRCEDDKYYIYLPNDYELPEQREIIPLENGALVAMNAMCGVKEIFEFVKKPKNKK